MVNMPKAETATERAAAAASGSRWQAPYQRRATSKTTSSNYESDDDFSVMSYGSPSPDDSTPPFPPKASFLGIPTEIREEIYGYFKTVPERNRTAAARAERNAIETARKSLQLVNHQVSEEWTPIFLSTTTIVATAVKGPGRTQQERARLVGYNQSLACVVFHHLFLNAYNVFDLNRITRLEYQMHNGSLRDLAIFARLLGNYMGDLESLQEVVFSATTSVNPYIGYVREFIHPGTKTSWGRAWYRTLYALGYRISWNPLAARIRNKFDFKKHGRPLRMWTTARRIGYDPHHRPCFGTILIREVQMVFRKPGIAPPPPVDGWHELTWR